MILLKSLYIENKNGNVQSIETYPNKCLSLKVYDD